MQGNQSCQRNRIRRRWWSYCHGQATPGGRRRRPFHASQWRRWRRGARGCRCGCRCCFGVHGGCSRCHGCVACVCVFVKMKWMKDDAAMSIEYRIRILRMRLSLTMISKYHTFCAALRSKKCAFIVWRLTRLNAVRRAPQKNYVPSCSQYWLPIWHSNMTWNP